MVPWAPMSRNPMRIRPRSRDPNPMPGDPPCGGPTSFDPFGAHRRGGINNPDSSIPEIRTGPRGRRNGHPGSLKMEPNLSRWWGGLPGGRRPDCRWRSGGMTSRGRWRRSHNGAERIQQSPSGCQAGNNNPIPTCFVPVHMSSFFNIIKGRNLRNRIRSRFLRIFE